MVSAWRVGWFLFPVRVLDYWFLLAMRKIMSISSKVLFQYHWLQKKGYSYLYILFLVLILGSCSREEISMSEWEEKGYNAGTEIKQGIPAFEATVIDYKRGGETILKVRLAEPVVIDVAKKPENWGYFQFPGIYRSEDGKLVASWNMAADAVTSYGKGESGVAVSNDEGKTWNPLVGTTPLGGGTKLPNGDRIQVRTPKALDVKELQLPEALGKSKENYGRTFVYFKMDDLPQELQGVYLGRLEKGSNAWKNEHAVLHDPKAVRYVDSGWFPVVWWGDLQVVPDGSVIAGIYPGFYLNDNNEVPPSGVLFYRSTDNGHSWNLQGKIPYQPDLKTDPNGEKRTAFGFTEPASILLDNGSYLCVMRTTDGLGNSPMYLSHSDDMGVTWTKPVTFTRSGVLPKLLQLENGVIVLASGRPGMQLRFALDGRGEIWTDPFEMLPFEGSKEDVSCGYPQIIPSGPDHFLLIYSDFKYPIGNGEFRKAIKIREIKVTPKR